MPDYTELCGARGLIRPIGCNTLPLLSSVRMRSEKLGLSGEVEGQNDRKGYRKRVTLLKKLFLVHSII